MSKLIEEYYSVEYEIYHVKDGKHSKGDITIYEDDSIQEIYYKISTEENVSHEYIHLWYFDEKNRYNLLGYNYEEIDILKDLYGLQEDDYVKECVDEDGLRTINVKNYNIHKTLENIYVKGNTIYYTTLQDYLSSINVKNINKDKWLHKIEYLHFINGVIRVYWPELTEPMIIEKNTKSMKKKMKLISKIVKNTDDILRRIYSYREIMKPKLITMNTFILNNKIEEEKEPLDLEIQ